MKKVFLFCAILFFNLNSMHFNKGRLLAKTIFGATRTNLSKIHYIHPVVLKQKFSTNFRNKKLITLPELGALIKRTSHFTKLERLHNVNYRKEDLNFFLERLDPNNKNIFIYIDDEGKVVKKNCERLEFYKRYKYTCLYFLLSHSRLLNHDYSKYFLYHAIQFKDYEMVYILLRLGINIYQEITIDATTHKLIDFVDSYIKSMYNLIIELGIIKDPFDQ